MHKSNYLRPLSRLSLEGYLLTKFCFINRISFHKKIFGFNVIRKMKYWIGGLEHLLFIYSEGDATWQWVCVVMSTSESNELKLFPLTDCQQSHDQCSSLFRLPPSLTLWLVAGSSIIQTQGCTKVNWFNHFNDQRSRCTGPMSADFPVPLCYYFSRQ